MVCAVSKASDQSVHMRRLIRATTNCLNILCVLSYLEFLSLKGVYTGSSESTLVKMPHCWKSHVAAFVVFVVVIVVVSLLAEIRVYQNCPF